MGRPAKFTREQLQAAALALVDREGLAGLTMRALGSALGTGAMTLYNYVATREELEVLVVEAVIAQAQWSTDVQPQWQDEVRDIATAWWGVVRAHPHAIPLILTRRSRSPAMFGVSEAMLRALAKSGRSGSSLLVAFRAVTALVTGLAQAELAGPLAVKAAESAENAIARFRALSVERFPYLVEIAGAAAHSAPEDEFRDSLDVLLEGLSQNRKKVL